MRQVGVTLGQRQCDENGYTGYGGADDDNDDKAVATMTIPAHDHGAATTVSKAATTKKTSSRRTMTYET